MNIYFFSGHTPDPKMIQDLGDSVTAQFKGFISHVIARDDQISFTETLHIGGETCQACHTIPAESIVVTEAPLALQEAWLKAGVVILLIPQIAQESKSWRHHAPKYNGLTQIHKIEVVTSSWAPRESIKTSNDSIQDQELQQAAHPTNVSHVLSLFRRLIWKPITPSISH